MPDIRVKAKLTGGVINTKAELGRIVEVPVGPDIYTGEYEVIPSEEPITLPTKDKLMENDLVVGKVWKELLWEQVDTFELAEDYTGTGQRDLTMIPIPKIEEAIIANANSHVLVMYEIEQEGTIWAWGSSLLRYAEKGYTVIYGASHIMVLDNMTGAEGYNGLWATPIKWKNGTYAGVYVQRILGRCSGFTKVIKAGMYTIKSSAILLRKEE